MAVFATVATCATTACCDMPLLSALRGQSTRRVVRRRAARGAVWCGVTGASVSRELALGGALLMAQPEFFRVLLVDDDIHLLESMAAVLSDQFVVRCASSGLQALRLMDREGFHVVCADWQMPGMDGVEFFREVAQKDLIIKPCFVLVTAHASELLESVPYADRKMLGMLRKPFSPQQLIDRVTQFAGVAHLKRSSAALNAALGERK